MQPRIFRKEALWIAGVTGDGADTGGVWADFDTRYPVLPFDKAEAEGYEIRFWDGSVAVARGADVHVGFAVAAETVVGEFTTVVLPATVYTSFDVRVADGYDSGNAEMDRWLETHADTYRLRELNGVRFVVECYDERFKGGNQPDSIVEIWLPLEEI